MRKALLLLPVIVLASCSTDPVNFTLGLPGQIAALGVNRDEVATTIDITLDDENADIGNVTVDPREDGLTITIPRKSVEAFDDAVEIEPPAL